MIVTLLLLQSWVPVSSVYFGMNGPSWSLACEAFFYAVFPFLVPRVKRMTVASTVKFMAVIYVAAVLLAVVLHVLLRDGPTVGILYVNPLYRLWEFAIGICLAHAVSKGWRPRISMRWAVLGVLVAFAAVNALSTAITLHVGPFARLPMSVLPNDLASLVMVPFFALLIAAAARRELDGHVTFFMRPWLVTLGKWSFALYLTHAFLLAAAARILPDTLNEALRYGITGAVVIMAIGFSGLVYQWVEMPLERRLRARQFPARVD
ncbi:hypothetical protein GY21_01620 [Cryobacterium roopkundense]|uniref:Acyltransferase 3 domain-containing protein n=2 Tax=Cryobacterium roopkundense TaxID=1001240 RepID=A0A099JTR5_9MICO|nr:hypothetical protein GY21_01620 [Cryobacterium roopkundense]